MEGRFTLGRGTAGSRLLDPQLPGMGFPVLGQRLALRTPARGKRTPCFRNLLVSSTENNTVRWPAFSTRKPPAGIHLPGGALVGEVFGILGICLLFIGYFWESSASCEPSSQSASRHSSEMRMALQILRRCWGREVIKDPAAGR